MATLLPMPPKLSSLIQNTPRFFDSLILRETFLTAARHITEEQSPTPPYFNLGMR